MFKKAWHRLISWTGVALVLLNVLVPTLSHALRAADPVPQQSYREMALAIAGDWCLSSDSGVVHADELRAIEQAVVLEATLEHLKACDFCDQAPLALALPLPAAPALLPPLPGLNEARFTAYAAVLLQRPAFELAESRAPPRG
ncbi:MAG: hypothetical protein RJA44_192 [Pseudomonadota bacterium]